MKFFIYCIAIQFYGQNNVFIYIENGNKVIVLENKTDIASAENRKLFIVQP